MAWDDSDEEWEAPDLGVTPPPGGPAQDAWSDEETEEDRQAAKARVEEKIKGTAHIPEKPKELTPLEKAIAEREAREIAEAQAAKEAKKKKLAAKLKADQAASALEQELADGDGGFRGQDDDDFEWDGGRGNYMNEDIPADNLPSLQKTGGEIDNFAPKTVSEFEKLASLIGAKIKPFQGKPGHMALMKRLIKEATDEMSTDDCKELSTSLATIFNNKREQPSHSVALAGAHAALHAYTRTLQLYLLKLHGTGREHGVHLPGLHACCETRTAHLLACD